MTDDLEDRIVVDPDILAGKPVVRGTRVPVYVVLEMLEEGSREDVLEAYPDLTEKDVRACLRYATKRLSREDLFDRESVA